VTQQMSPASFTIWAKEAVDGFLGSESAPLNDSIAKIASDNDLTPQQVNQICQQANVMAYEGLFKVAEDKTFSFPLADSKAIIAGLAAGEDANDENLAETEGPSLDFFVEPPQKKTASDWKVALGVAQVSNEHQVREKVAEAQHVLDNIRQAQEEIRARQIAQTEIIYEARAKFAHEVKQETLSFDGGPVLGLTKIAHAIRHSMGGKRRTIAVGELCKVAATLADEGALGVRQGLLFKKLAEAAPAGLISTEMDVGDAPEDKVTVVNGNHPIIMHVNQLVDQVSEEDRLKEGLQMLEDKAGYAITKMEDLNTTALTDDYVRRQTTQDQPIWVGPDPWKHRMRAGVAPK